MKHVLGTLVFAAIAICLSLPVHAGFMIEPYLGYEMGKLKQGGGTADIDTKGLHYGARLGYDFGGLKAGVDYQASSQDAKQSGTSGKYKPTDLGVFVGYQFPMLLQAYLSYFVKSDAKFDDSTIPETFSGSGMRAGIGWMVMPFVAINLEFITRTYNKYDGTTLPDDLKGTSTGLSVSFPF